MIYIFKCPYCNGEMDYDITLKKLVCRQCRQGMPIHAYNMQDMQFISEESDIGIDAQEQGLSGAVCPSCGAEILMGKYEISGSCAFCGSDIVIDRGGKKNLIPEKIIPFRLNKAQVSHMIQNWWRENAFAPRLKIKEQDIQMIYIPVWLMDFTAVAEMEAEVSRTQIVESRAASTFGVGAGGRANLYQNCGYRRWSFQSAGGRGNFYQNEEQKVYGFDARSQTVHKQIEAFVRLLPQNASGKIGQTRFRSIEPFDYTELQKFHPGYLDGILAERYYYPPNETIPAAREAAESYARYACKERVLAQAGALGYLEKVKMERANGKLEKIWYALLPVALYNYSFHGKKYTLYVNGQTGKTGGDVPVSNRRKIPYFFGAMFSASVFLMGAVYSMLVHMYGGLGRMAAEMLFWVVVSAIIWSRLMGERPGKENKWNIKNKKPDIKKYFAAWMFLLLGIGGLLFLTGFQYTGFVLMWNDKRIINMWIAAIPFVLVLGIMFAFAFVRKLVHMETDLSIAKTDSYIAPYSVHEIM